MPKFDIDLADYERFTSECAFYVRHHTGDFFEINYLMLGLVGEAGECADAWKKITRVMNPDDTVTVARPLENGDPTEVVKVLYELGDVMWYVTHLVRALGISFDDLMLCNTYKLHMRHQAAHGEWGWPYQHISLKEAADRVRQVEALITSYKPEIPHGDSDT